jgi:uroporphyrinogen-III synthase
MQGKRIAILESRLRDQLAGLIARSGGIPLSAPALAELPDGDPHALQALLERCLERAPRLFVFQTGVGTQALFEMADALGRAADLADVLARTTVAERGPKPAGVLRAHSIRIDISTQAPHTTQELLHALEPVAIAGERVVVQRYGESNRELHEVLQARGAEVIELPTYRWGLPQDTTPLTRLLDALDANAVDAAVFTSASQARNLFTFAAEASREAPLRSGLARIKVYSIGPVCSRALRALDVHVDGEASPPKLGPLLRLLEQQLA